MKEEINLPKDYSPYLELSICSNKLVSVQIPFLIDQTPLLLIGKNSVPQIWRSARNSPGVTNGSTVKAKQVTQSRSVR